MTGYLPFTKKRLLKTGSRFFINVNLVSSFMIY
jgi:hypothetical protein